MRVLLVPPKNNYPAPNPSLDIVGQGFPYIAAALRAAGHEVRGVNINHHWCRPAAPATLEASLRRAIAEFEPELVGVGGQAADFLFIRDAMAVSRRAAPHTPIVCGGNLVTYDPEYIFATLAPDLAVLGDGEDTIVRLAAALAARGDCQSIPNLAYRRDGSPVFTAVRYATAGLDELPFPDYDAFDYGSYLAKANQADNHFYGHTRHQPRLLPISLGRSCPFDCTFCCHTGGPQYRRRSIDSAIREIVHFYEKYRFNILFIYDELFALRPERIAEFCTKLTEAKRAYHMDFDWTCDLRVSHVEAESLALMKDAGCIFIGYGFESASPAVLVSMKKGVTVEQMRRAIRLTEAAGIGVQGNFIFGDPAETLATMAETRRFFEEHCRDLMLNLQYLTPYPGSEVFRQGLLRGVIRSRRQYYEDIGPIGHHKINLTRLPDEVFFPAVDGLVAITAPTEHGCLGLPHAPHVGFSDRGPYAPDAERPRFMRRSSWAVTVTCPHCRTTVEYHYPLARFEIGRLRVFCAACHKRFTLDIPRRNLPLVYHGLDIAQRVVLVARGELLPAVARKLLRTARLHRLAGRTLRALGLHRLSSKLW